MLCLKKRRTYSFTQGVCTELPRRLKKDNRCEGSLNMAVTTLPRKNRSKEERPSRMVLTVTEDTPADMLAGSMELLVQLPRESHLQTQRVTVQRSTPMMDLLVQIATAHKLAASSYTLQAIGERGIVLPHQPNTPIGALDALQVKLLPKQGTFVPKKSKQPTQPFETTFRLQVHLPRNQLYVSRVSPRMNLGEILEEVCREKGLDKNKYELRHPVNLESLDLSLSLQDYHLQEVTLYAKQGRALSSVLSTQDIMALQRQEEKRRQQAKQGVFGFVFKKSKESSLSTDSLGGRSASPARSDETGRSTSPVQPPARPQRKRRPAPKPPMQTQMEGTLENAGDSSKDKVVISHSRNSSDSSGYHEASVLSDNPDSAGRLPETLPRRSKLPQETSRKLAQTSQSSKSLCNLASVPGTLSRGISSTSLSSTGLRKKRAAPPPPVTRPLSSAISTQGLERIVDSEESLTSDMDPSKPSSDIGASSKANSDIEDRPKASSDICVTTVSSELSSSVGFIKPTSVKLEADVKSQLEQRQRSESINVKLPQVEPNNSTPVEDALVDARVCGKRDGEPVPLPKPRTGAAMRPEVSKRKLPSPLSRSLSADVNKVDSFKTPTLTKLPNGIPSNASEANSGSVGLYRRRSTALEGNVETALNTPTSENERFLTPDVNQIQEHFDHNSVILEERGESKSCSKEAECKKQLSQDDKDCKEDTEASVIQENNLSLLPKENMEQGKKQCAVISTMPKCEQLNALVVNDSAMQNVEIESLKSSPKKTSISRTASKSNDFEMNSLERQKRHLTSLAEDITFALNLNVELRDDVQKLSGGDTQKKEEERNITSHAVNDEISHQTVGGPDENLSETDVLLQKVSDTLSSSLSVSSFTEVPVCPLKNKSDAAKILNETEQKNKKNSESFEGVIINTSTPNLTVNSQQDTSDYVSAADEDLAVADWYQIPAPPSAFCDRSSPVFDNFEIDAPEPFTRLKTQEPTAESESSKNDLNITEAHEPKQEVMEKVKEKPIKRQKSELCLKKEMINELENKIGTLPQCVKDIEHRRVVSSASMPKIAPADNTLSNFTITTYSRQKSLNIFEAAEEQSKVGNSDERFIKSFATLSRNRSNLEEPENENCIDKQERSLGKKKIIDTEDGTKDMNMEPKTQVESLKRWQNDCEKSNIQRSRSYISVCEKPNLQAKISKEDNSKKEEDLERNCLTMKKAVSVNALNASAPKNNEKFSQWRDNILKRQENPTKEKQLQSIQVLKSILPQLKNAQQAEENMTKESKDTVVPERTSSETAFVKRSMESRTVSTVDFEMARNGAKTDERENKINSEGNKKRYTYSGPPMINLGSWSERPSVNVHIKMDTDYKFGHNGSNNKTGVHMNGSRDEVDRSNDRQCIIKLQKSKFEHYSENKTANEVTKKISKIQSSEGKMNTDDKAIVAGVDLKRCSQPADKPDDNVIDTTPLNFKELAKAFGQEVCLRPKFKRSTLNQNVGSQQGNDTNKQNGHINSDRCLTNGQQDISKVKRFSSIIGIQGSNPTNTSLKSSIIENGNASKCATKGFKISNVNERQNCEYLKKHEKEEASRKISIGTQSPRPPTMPIITGVTLKNTRPKSMPVQMDRRDILLESIRNFGGRENLKSAAGRC